MRENFLTIPKEMQAVEIKKFGSAENLRLCVRPTPKLSNNQLLIKILFAGVNRPDILQRQGNLDLIYMDTLKPECMPF